MNADQIHHHSLEKNLQNSTIPNNYGLSVEDIPVYGVRK